MAGGLQVALNARLIAGLDRARSAAIDGLRHPTDFDSLSAAFGASFRLVFLEAPQEVRFERLRSRYATGDAFQAAETQPVEAYIDNLRPLATLVIPNVGSVLSLHQRLDEWLAAEQMGDPK